MLYAHYPLTSIIIINLLLHNDSEEIQWSIIFY